jgi:hypothetical protein
MFGLIRRIGCAIILLIAGAALWHFRDLWWPKVRERLSDRASQAVERVVP